MGKTFGMIKPEGLQYSDDIETRIEKIGLEIIKKVDLTLNKEQFETIYGHAQEKVPNIYNKLMDYMTSNQVRILEISGEDVAERLLELRGASNAAEAFPGTIRGDYARDQDYKTLYSNREFAKNVFHAADPEEAEFMVKYFFGGKEKQ